MAAAEGPSVILSRFDTVALHGLELRAQELQGNTTSTARNAEILQEKILLSYILPMA